MLAVTGERLLVELEPRGREAVPLGEGGRSPVRSLGSERGSPAVCKHALGKDIPGHFYKLLQAGRASH